ncbi:MAG: hypothetical protein P8Z73_13080 [Desulfobacteraceae bacterium]|jgi:hypothetical protein
MTHHHETHAKGTETTKRVFVSRAQVLPEENRGQLSEKEKEFESSCQEPGVWLELFCPDNECLSEGESFNVPVFCEDPKVKKSLVLELFCPYDSCDVAESTRLP